LIYYPEVYEFYSNLKFEYKNLYSKGFMDNSKIQKSEINLFYVNDIYRMYENIIEMSTNIAKKFGHIDESIIEIQKRILVNSKWNDGIFEANYDIHTWEKKKTKYSISFFNFQEEKFIFSRNFAGKSLITKIVE
jgi:hypothetical protein